MLAILSTDFIYHFLKIDWRASELVSRHDCLLCSWKSSELSGLGSHKFVSLLWNPATILFVTGMNLVCMRSLFFFYIIVWIIFIMIDITHYYCAGLSCHLIYCESYSLSLCDFEWVNYHFTTTSCFFKICASAVYETSILLLWSREK